MLQFAQLRRLDLCPRQFAIHSVQHTDQQSEHRPQPEIAGGVKRGHRKTDEQGDERNLVWRDRRPTDFRNEPGLDRSMDQRRKVQRSVLRCALNETFRGTATRRNRRRKENRTKMLPKIRDIGRLARRIQDLDATCGGVTPEDIHDGGAGFLLRHPALIEKSRCLTRSSRQGRSGIDEQRCRRLLGQSPQQASVVVVIGGDDQDASVSRINMPKQLLDHHWPGAARLVTQRELPRAHDVAAKWAVTVSTDSARIVASRNPRRCAMRRILSKSETPQRIENAPGGSARMINCGRDSIDSDRVQQRSLSGLRLTLP